MLFSARKKEKKVFLIVDVQSVLIRSTLVLDDDVPTILSTYNKTIYSKARLGSDRMLKVLETTITEINQHANMFISEYEGGIYKHINTVHIVLSSPWILSRAETLDHIFEKETEVTRELIDELITGQHDDSTELVDSKNTEIIEQKIFGVNINGYPISDWQGKFAKRLSITSVNSISGQMIIKIIKNIFSDYGRSDLQFHSALLLQYIAMQNILPSLSTYVLVHVHGELTDITITQNNSCKFFGSYPIGVHTLVRKIANKRSVSNYIAESELTLYSQKNFTHSESQSMVADIEEPAKIWFQSLYKILSHHLDNEHISKIPFIVYSSTHENFFEHIVKLNTNNSNVKLFPTDSLTHLVKYLPHTEHTRQSSLYALSIHRLNIDGML
jgi:hypothetical protein